VFADGILFALGALVLFGVSDFLYKRAAVDGVPTHQLMMVQSWTYGFLVWLYGIVTGTLVIDRPALLGALAGCFAFTGFYNFAKSLQHGSVSINAPIFRLSFAITATLAILFLGERLTPWKLAGLLLAPVAVWLLAGSAGPNETRRATAASLTRVFIATLGVGIANFIYKIAMSEGATPAGMLVVQAWLVITASTVMVLRWDGLVRPKANTMRYALTCAVLLSVGFVLLVEALRRAEASIIVPIAQLGLIVTSLLGIVLMRESLTGRKMTGIAAAVLALITLANS